jgi:CTP-dependent riboflavin kinase
MVLTGTIVKGVGQASYFTSLDWVQEQCLAKLGFKPYPGTLNVELPAQDVRIMEACREKGVELLSPDPAFCNARALRVSVQSLPGALILPAEEVSVHATNIVEIISPVSIKDTLGMADGHEITIRLDNQEVS